MVFPGQFDLHGTASLALDCFEGLVFSDVEVLAGPLGNFITSEHTK